jgi:hypothetical protein
MTALNAHRILQRAGLVIATVAASAAGPATSVSEADAKLTVVELFTSQGCSSCPPADAFLGELAQEQGLLALSLPIDYWDYLGWRDTLARPEHKARQYAYARRLGVQPYTPQIVIDGAIDVVGGKRNEVFRRLEERRQSSKDRVPVTVRETTNDIEIDVGAGRPRNAAVYLVRFEGLHEVAIGDGENRGKTVRYAHVVREIRSVGEWNGSVASFHVTRAELAHGDGEQYAVILQESGMGPILGAADLPEPN